MTPDELRAAAAVMLAAADGATIQYRDRGCDEVWYDTDGYWNWHSNEYRVKPEPRVLWRVYDANGSTWTCDDGKRAREIADDVCGGTVVEFREVVK